MNDVRSIPVEHFLISSPYVADEHRQLLSDAEKALEDYSENLLIIVKREFLDHSPNTRPKLEDIEKTERAFLDDPIRNQLIKNITLIKTLVERPRYKVLTAQPTGAATNRNETKVIDGF